MFFGASKKLQNYQVEPFIDHRKTSNTTLLVPKIDFKLKCYSPKRLNILINWISLHTTLKEDLKHFQWTYDTLIHAMVHPQAPESQKLLSKYMDRELRDRLVKRR